MKTQYISQIVADLNSATDIPHFTPDHFQTFSNEELIFIMAENLNPKILKPNDTVGYFYNTFLHIFENRPKAKSEPLKTVKVLKYGIWLNNQVILNDKEQTLVRNPNWLIKVPTTTIVQNQFKLIYQY